MVKGGRLRPSTSHQTSWFSTSMRPRRAARRVDRCASVRPGATDGPWCFSRVAEALGRAAELAGIPGGARGALLDGAARPPQLNGSDTPGGSALVTAAPLK
jgi:hypothetical protein